MCTGLIKMFFTCKWMSVRNKICFQKIPYSFSSLWIYTINTYHQEIDRGLPQICISVFILPAGNRLQNLTLNRLKMKTHWYRWQLKMGCPPWSYAYERAFADKLERNCHFLAPGRNCTALCQELQDFRGTSQLSLHRNNEIYLSFCKKSWKWCQFERWVSVCHWIHCILNSCGSDQ